jgi:hypothetical protein
LDTAERQRREFKAQAFIRKRNLVTPPYYMPEIEAAVSPPGAACQASAADITLKVCRERKKVGTWPRS